MIALDYTVLIQIFSFLVLWSLLARLIFKPYVGLLEERERKTDGVKAEAASLTEEGERLRSEYDGRIGKAKDEAYAAKEMIVNDARQARDRLLSQAREEATKALVAAREEIQREIEGARELARREAEGAAQQMAERILGRKVE